MIDSLLEDTEVLEDIEIDFANNILEKLLPMHNVELEIRKNNIRFFVKDGLDFGYIKNQELYFLDSKKIYRKMSLSSKNHPDTVLIAATKSFWIASGAYNPQPLF